VQRISDQDIKAYEPKRAWNKKVSFVDEVTSLDSDEEPLIGLAEWVKNKKPMSCPFGHKEPEKFAFDINKPIGYLTSYFKKAKSSCHPIM